MTPEELDNLIGRNVRSVRSGMRLRQEDVADEIGWDRAIITRIEAGRRRLTFTDVIALCGALKVDLRQLLAGADAETMRKLGIDRRS